MALLSLIIVNLLIIPNICSIWSPELNIKMNQEEEFVISEDIDSDEFQDVYEEEELIKQSELEALKLQNGKYFRLHNMAKKYKIPESKFAINPKYKIESNLELIKPKPWIGGRVNEDNEIIRDKDTVYFDEQAKNNELGENLAKRAAPEDYNYNAFKAEYEEAIKKAEKSNETLKYKEVKEEETPDETLKSLVKISTNCTEEEKNQMGIAGIKCFLAEARNKHLSKGKKSYMLKKAFLMLFLWIIVYLMIALPLWCQYGWCCCCCKCKFCNPRDEIDEVKTFFANNPAGVYHDEAGNLKKYKPTTYEIYAQRNLEKAIQRL